jgi:hypothetical protein
LPLSTCQDDASDDRLMYDSGAIWSLHDAYVSLAL